MSDAIRLCRFVGGRCLSYCSSLDKVNDRCRRYPNPPSRWGRGADVIEVDATEWANGERGSGESSIVERVIGRPSEHTPSPTPPNMDGASLEELQQALCDL